jgi:hypothetical protein
MPFLAVTPGMSIVDYTLSGPPEPVYRLRLRRIIKVLPPAVFGLAAMPPFQILYKHQYRMLIQDYSA